MNYTEIKKTFKESLQELNSNVISKHPKVLMNYEPHISFELSQILLAKIPKEYKRWEDFDFYFDSKRGLEFSGVFGWGFNFRWRPDIVIKPRSLNSAAMVIEIKIIRAMQPEIDYEFGTRKYHKSAEEQMKAYKKDKDKLQEIVNVNSGKDFKGVSLAFYLDENFKPPQGKGWTSINTVSNRYKCHYRFEYIG